MLFRILVAASLALTPTLARSEPAACDSARDQLQAAFRSLKPIADKVEDLIGQPGYSTALKRSELAKQGLPIAERQMRAAQMLASLGCYDFNGRDTDWSRLVARSKEIYDMYVFTARNH